MLPRIFFLIILLVVGPGAGPLVSADETVKIAKVIDGDTIQLADGRKARLRGINTPEKREPYYYKAKRFLESLVLDREIRLEFERDREDGYGRLLVYVHAGRHLVNDRLIGEGLAHVMLIGEKGKYDASFLASQAEARKRQKGIWSVWRRGKNLKITSVHPWNPEAENAYLRVASLAERPLQLAGYNLGNESGEQFVFPARLLPPGRTVVVTSRKPSDDRGDGGQMVLHWPQARKLEEKEDTVFLRDPSGNLVDQFHYEKRNSGKRRAGGYGSGKGTAKRL